MKKILIGLLAIALVGLAVPSLTAAVVAGGGGGGGGSTPGPPETCKIRHDLSDVNPCSGCSPGTEAPTTNCAEVCCVLDTVETIGDWMFWALLTVALIMILYGAFLFVTAGGNTEQVASARRTLIYALAGIALGFLARLMVEMVQNLIA